jgi:hypothetical protein
MTSTCWRLLAVFSLIFVAAVFLRGQDVTADRPAILASTRATLPQAPLTETVQRPEPIGVPRRYPVSPGTTALPQIVSAAGIIFSGTVTSVGRAVGGAAPFFRPEAISTTVTFQVDHAIRGTSLGQSLTIHEWAGLWSSGERYRVGERVLLFLYSPSKLGLTSPVAGGAGRFAIDPRGRILLTAQNVGMLAADPHIGGRTIIPSEEFLRAVRRAGGGK